MDTCRYAIKQKGATPGQYNYFLLPEGSAQPVPGNVVYDTSTYQAISESDYLVYEFIAGLDSSGSDKIQVVQTYQDLIDYEAKKPTLLTVEQDDVFNDNKTFFFKYGNVIRPAGASAIGPPILSGTTQYASDVTGAEAFGNEYPGQSFNIIVGNDIDDHGMPCRGYYLWDGYLLTKMYNLPLVEPT